MIYWKTLSKCEAWKEDPRPSSNAKRSLLPASLLVEVVAKSTTEYTIVDLTTGVTYLIPVHTFEIAFQRLN